MRREKTKLKERQSRESRGMYGSNNMAPKDGDLDASGSNKNVARENKRKLGKPDGAPKPGKGAKTNTKHPVDIEPE